MWFGHKGETITSMKNNKEIALAFKNSIPVMAGYIVTGAGFGILLASHGYGPLWAAFMVIVMFAGSMQFVAVDLMVSGASLVTSALMTFMVNVRHVFYAISMVSHYRDIKGGIKAYLAYGLTDETYALVCELNLPEDVDKTKYCFFLTLMNECYWFTGCVVGDVIGVSVDFDFTGIDFAMTAMFVAIATEQWCKNKNHWAAITGLVVSVACLLVFGPDKFLIPTMILITVCLEIERRTGLLPKTYAEAKQMLDGGGSDD